MTTTRHNAASSSDKVKVLAGLKKNMSDGEMADYVMRRYLEERKASSSSVSSPLRKDLAK